MKFCDPADWALGFFYALLSYKIFDHSDLRSFLRVTNTISAMMEIAISTGS